MATGKSGSFELSGTKGMTLKVFWSETYDVSTNKSVVSVTDLQLKTAYYIGGFYLDGTIKIGGKTAVTFDSILGNHFFDCQTLNGYYSVYSHKDAPPWKVSDIVHDSDGSKSVSIVVDLHGYTVNENSGNAWYVSATKSVTLTTIPRASTLDSLSCATSYFTGKLTYKYTPKSSSFYNRCNISLNLDGTYIAVKSINLGKKAASQQTATVSLSESELETIYNNLPGAPKGVLRFTLRTYSDSGYSTQVGDAGYKEVTLYIPNDSTTQPSVSMSLVPVGSLPAAFDGLYIQGKTKVKATLSATGKFGATIKSYSMKVEGSTYPGLTSGYLPNYGSIRVYGDALDTRSFIGSTYKDITVIAYSKPKITVSVCGRCDEEGNLSDSGTYLKIKATRSYSKVTSGGVQKNFCQIRYRYKAASASTYSGWTTILDSNMSGNTVETGSLLGGVLDVDKTYVVQVQAVDDIGESAVATIDIPTEAVHTHRTKNGIGFGKYCEGENLMDVGWDARFNGDVYIGATTLKDYILAVISEGG